MISLKLGLDSKKIYFIEEFLTSKKYWFYLLCKIKYNLLHKIFKKVSQKTNHYDK